MGGDPIFAQGQNRQLATGDLKALPSLRRAASNIPGFCTQVCRKFSNRPLASSAAKMAAFHVAVRPEAVPYPWGELNIRQIIGYQLHFQADILYSLGFIHN